MTAFKLGDIVVRTQSTWNGMHVGDTSEISDIQYSIFGKIRSVSLVGFGDGHSPHVLELVYVQPEGTLPELTSVLHFTQSDGTQRIHARVVNNSPTYNPEVFIQSLIKEHRYGFHSHGHYLTPDDALDLASNIRRIAMAAKRKQAQR